MITVRRLKMMMTKMMTMMTKMMTMMMMMMMTSTSPSLLLETITVKFCEEPTA